MVSTIRWMRWPSPAQRALPTCFPESPPPCRSLQGSLTASWRWTFSSTSRTMHSCCARSCVCCGRAASFSSRCRRSWRSGAITTKPTAHFRRYRKRDLVRRVREAGLEVGSCQFFKCAFFPPLWVLAALERRGLIPRRDSFFAVPDWLNEDVVRVLTEVRRITCKVVVVVDTDGTPPGLLRRTLIALDRGRFMRSPERLADVVRRVFPVERTVRFDVGLYTEILLRCPSGAAAAAPMP